MLRKVERWVNIPEIKEASKDPDLSFEKFQTSPSKSKVQTRMLNKGSDLFDQATNKEATSPLGIHRLNGICAVYDKEVGHSITTPLEADKNMAGTIRRKSATLKESLDSIVQQVDL